MVLNNRSKFALGLLLVPPDCGSNCPHNVFPPGLSDSWTSLDADRFHQMAQVIINGSEPYVTYIDPKPPLLFFTVALMDILAPPGSVDILVMTVVNVICALLIWRIGWEDYGCLAGYTAGLLLSYLISFY